MLTRELIMQYLIQEITN